MACCGRDAKWKREKIQDHKFDYIDVDDFISKSCLSYSKYGLVYVMTLKSILSYMAELIMVILLILVVAQIRIDGLPDPSVNNLQGGNSTTTAGQKSIQEVLSGGFLADPSVRIGLIIASVFVSYILLAFEWKKAFTIIQSRDISYAFTSTIAYRYYAIRSFPHFCVFDKINKSKKIKDTLSLWVYFRLKGWKKLIFAESPRQILNALNVYTALRFYAKDKGGGIKELFDAFSVLRTNMNLAVVLVLSSILVLVWMISILTLIIAFFMYIFLVQSIRGNLKEYCVHKIDKRIDGLLKKKSRKRVLDARKAELEELERHRNDKDDRAAPPLGMAIGPRYPNLALNYENGSEYGDSSYAASDYGGGDNMYPRPLAPQRANYGDSYARSDYGGPARSDYGGPARSDYGGPARSEYGGPARSDYSGPARSDYGGPARSDYGGPAISEFGGPARSEYGGYGNYAGSNFGGLNNNPYAGSAAGSQVGYPQGKPYYNQSPSEYGGSESQTYSPSYAAQKANSGLSPVPERYGSNPQNQYHQG